MYTHVKSSHRCNVCDMCLTEFFTRTQVCEVIDVAAILSNPRLRESISDFYTSAIRCVTAITAADSGGWQLRQRQIVSLVTEDSIIVLSLWISSLGIWIFQSTLFKWKRLQSR
jgi:hypothetical protein